MYVHLHSHTEASIADGLFGPAKWVEALKQKGFKAHAVTDHGTMTSLLPFYHAMRKEKMTPILGAEFYFVDEPTVKTTENRKAGHIILIAENYDGFRNLMKLSKLSFTEGFYFRPRIGMEWLRKYSEGLVCLSACQGGVLSQQVWAESLGKPTRGLENRFSDLVDIFGNRFYVEFQGHAGTGPETNRQEIVNSAFYGRLRGLPGFQPVVTNDCHYILPEHAKIQEKLKEMAYGSTGGENAGQSYTSCDSLWLKSAKDVFNTFRTHHEYLPKEFVAEGMRNTEAIFDRVKGLELPTGKRYLPTFRADLDSKDVFKKLTTLKLKRFLKSDELRAKPAVYIERFAKEYKVICKYGLQDYFLIVWDLLRFAREKGIYVGIGRGSAAGCLISYLLDIVRIDPIEYKLIFERFLNEHRCETGELPDIDLDIESDRRQEVKDYIFEKYGREKVCEIGTYGRIRLKTAIIDFGKAFKVADQKTLLSITTKLDLDKKDTDDLEAAAEADPKLMSLLASNEDYAFTVEEIIGQIKSQSVHPAGVIICSEPIENITPLKTQKSTKTEDRVIVTQAEDKQVIAQGLMKMDILGLKEYDIIKFVIENAPGCDLTRENFDKEIIRREREKPNRKVWELFRQGRTEGVFQFASDGMKQLLQMMRPTGINDLIAANALYRPGCLENGWHIQYCKRKSGEEKVRFVHPDLESSLGDTYGVVVYQEQFMNAMHVMGGISLVEADTVRSALTKKDSDKLDKFRERFIEGATSRIGAEKAAELWDQIEKASGYTFNKSHSAAYSVLAYISQYLKVNYPPYFWAAQLEWDTRKNKRDELVLNRRAAAEMGIEFITPHINHSTETFRVIDGKIQWSLQGVDGIGASTAKEIIRCRGLGYLSFEDFYSRVNKAKVRINHMENLILAGAFDNFGDRREHLEWLHAAKKKKHVTLSNEQLMLKFYEIMGFFEQKLKKVRTTFSKSVLTEQDLREYMPGEYVVIGGMISEVRQTKTKNGDSMGFATLVDLDEKIELTFFPAEWSACRSALHVGSIVEIRGSKSGYGGKQNAIEAEKIESR